MWTGSSYTCAYTASNGDNKIGAFATEVWTSSTAPGYEKRFKCQRNSGGVSISSAYTNSGGTNIGSSITYTAFNTKDGSRHWTGAVLWNTPKGGEGAASQFRDNCDGYTVKSNLFYVPKVSMSGPTSIPSNTNGSYQITVSTPDGGGPATGSVSLFHQASTSQAKPNPPSRRCDGTGVATSDVLVGQAALVNGTATISNVWYGPSQYKLYAVYAGQPLGAGGVPAYCAAPPVEGLTAGISNSILLSSGMEVGGRSDAAVSAAKPRGDFKASLPRLRTVNSQATAPDMAKASCPTGWLPMQANAGSSTVVIPDSAVVPTKRGAYLRDNAVPAGTVLNLQVVCRPKGASVVKIKRSVFGSQYNDQLSSGRGDSVIFGGLGKDRIAVRNSGSVALGGGGADQIAVSAAGAAANGGSGRDVLVATNKGIVLLVGGSGRDRLVGAKGGRTKINAADGRPGDVVRCQGKSNQVIADPGDRLVGKCQVVTPSS